jgi:hypothetical protein
VGNRIPIQHMMKMEKATMVSVSKPYTVEATAVQCQCCGQFLFTKALDTTAVLCKRFRTTAVIYQVYSCI